MARVAVLVAVGCLVHACVDRKPDREARGDAAERPTAATAPAPDRDEPAPAPDRRDDGPPGELVTIPPGTVHAGSPPGTAGRWPAREMDDVPVELREIEMERGVRPQRGLSREQAAAICAGEDRRLCTELEWEWACEGEEHRDRATHRSPFGVVGMGEQREWTASPWGATEADRALGVALRGALPDAPAAARRCAARTPSVPPPAEDGRPPADPSTADVAFRCCAGETNAATVTLEPPRGTFFPIDLPADKLAAIVRSIPELADVHDAPRAFSQSDTETVLGRPGPGQPQQGWRFGPGPLLWTPERGDQLVVLLGRTVRHSFVAVLYRLPGDRFRHASSLVMRDDTTPLALAWGALRRELVWTPCWACGEVEGGKIVYRPETFDVRVTH